MWTCPECGRVFKKTNQAHYCGKAPESVEKYIALQAPETRAAILELCSIIRRHVPGAKERIAWSMPFFEKDGREVSFAACKNHISLYMDTEVLHAAGFSPDESVIKKNALYLPYGKPLPEEARVAYWPQILVPVCSLEMATTAFTYCS